MAQLADCWRRGGPDAVADVLRHSRDLRGAELVRAAIAQIAGFDNGQPLPPVPAAARDRMILLDIIIAFGQIEAARACARACYPDDASSPNPVLTGLNHLQALLGHMPALPEGQADLADDPTLDVQIVPRPGADRLLLVFTGGAHKLNGPLAVAHRWLCRLGSHIAYLRDFAGLHFLGGIGSLGAGYPAMIDGLHGIARSLGARRILCLGSSSGSYGALNCGLDLGARRILCLAGPTVLDGAVPLLLERHRLLGPDAPPLDTGALDLARRYAAAERRPRVRMLFGADNAVDRREAEHLGRVPGVELVPLRGSPSTA